MNQLGTFATQQVLRLNPDLREQLAAFSSHFTLNLSLFAIVIAASVLLEPTEFAHLSLANNYIMVVAMVLDFGLNGACLKLSIENDQRRFVHINLAIKAVLFLICFVTLVFTWALYGPVREVIIVTCAAGLSFWYATRLIEQFDRRFLRYAILNLELAASRILFGGFSLITKNWVIIVFAVHVAALLPICVSTAKSLFRQWDVLKGSFQRSTVSMILRLAPAFFLGAAFFSAIPVIIQTIIYMTGDTQATGAFGIVVLIVGPIALLTNTLRIYLQPQIISKCLNSVDAFDLGPGSLHVVVAGYAILLLLGIVPLSYALDWVAQERFPQIGTFLLIYGSASCLTDAVGLYNIRVLRRSLVWVGLFVNMLRAALIAAPLFIPQIDALMIVSWSALVLIGGELLLLWVLAVVGRPRQVMRAV